MPTTKVYLAFDERMSLHKPSPRMLSETDSSADSEDAENATPMENPMRIFAIYNKLQQLETKEGSRRFIEIPCIPADRNTIQLVHSKDHYDKMRNTMYMTDEELLKVTIPDDLYFCRDTFMAARLACGGVIECVNAVTDNHTRSTRAIAIVRPPGHHAGYDEAMGFCYFNNIAVAAKHATHTGRADRVLILDWDIHHGNGIQDLTFDDPNIFYLSIHRASFGAKKKNFFYPGTGRPSEVGVGDGAGTNLNICWKEGGMGDVEYARVFHDVVLPLLLSFKPALVMVACGLDAAQGDLLGDCGLTSDMYYTMTRCILEAAPQTPIVVALEGGYNLDMSAECMESVALALLDESLHLKDRQRGYYWTTASILPQRPPVVTHEMDKLERYWKDANSISKIATNSIKCSSKALARKGGTCLGGTHFLCHHSACLPMRKRKMLTCTCIVEPEGANDGTSG